VVKCFDLVVMCVVKFFDYGFALRKWISIVIVTVSNAQNTSLFCKSKGDIFYERDA